MRLALKLLLIMVIATSAFAPTATSASAQVDVANESGGSDPCPAVTKIGHHVEGGCHVEFLSTEHISLVAFVPTRVVLMNCNWHFEARIGPDGEGWVTGASLTDEPVPPTPPCTRVPCDEANGTFIPWPIHIFEFGPGDESVELTFCLRTIPSGRGGRGSECGVHLEFDEIGDHDYEIGHLPSFEACEVSPSPPAVVGLEDAHFTYEFDSPRIEVIH